MESIISVDLYSRGSDPTSQSEIPLDPLRAAPCPLLPPLRLLFAITLKSLMIYYSMEQMKRKAQGASIYFPGAGKLLRTCFSSRTNFSTSPGVFRPEKLTRTVPVWKVSAD